MRRQSRDCQPQVNFPNSGTASTFPSRSCYTASMMSLNPFGPLRPVRLRAAGRYLPLWLALLGTLVSGSAFGAETDQFLTWDIELADASGAFNDYLDQEIAVFLDRANRRTRPYGDATALTLAFYTHLFQGLHASRVRHWLKHDEGVARYPDNSFSDLAYQQQSIFQKPAFPFVLPMAQTIRVGDVYFGIDKIGHMLGFGRRYLQIYERHRNAGLDDAAALEKVIAWGIHHEAGLVGKLVDGIFSHADLEANYQGFRMARAFCAGETPLFHNVEGVWVYRGGLDIRDYITPDFDESYNLNDYARWRYRRVAPVFLALYGDNPLAPRVQKRFARYRALGEPSLSKRLIDAHFDGRVPDPLYVHLFEKERNAKR